MYSYIIICVIVENQYNRRQLLITFQFISFFLLVNKYYFKFDKTCHSFYGFIKFHGTKKMCYIQYIDVYFNNKLE